MPLTFPSHTAPVLALKLWRPARFDGVALVAGTVAPDVVRLVSVRFSADTHSLPVLLWWCLPVAWVCAWLFRRPIASVTVHLPASRRFAWPAYGRLATARHAPLVTAGSALLGAVTHVAWDRLTRTDGWLRALLGVGFHASTGVRWWTVSGLTGTALGTLAALALAVLLGRRLAADGRERLVHVAGCALLAGAACVRPRSRVTAG